MPPIRGGGPRNVYTLNELINKGKRKSQIISPYRNHSVALPADENAFKFPGKLMSAINEKLSRFDRVSYFNFPMFYLKNYIFNPFSIKEFRDTECYISTAWQTVYLGKTISKIQNKPLLYFVQAYETSFGTNKIYKKLADDTYKLKLPMFTQSQWLKEFFKEKFSVDVEWIGLGLDHSKFFQNGLNKNKQVFTIARPEFDKGFDIFVEAMNIIWNRRKDLKILIAGSRDALIKHDMRFKYEFLDWIKDDYTLAKLYSESIFVNTGRSEAIPMPPIEAMACGSSVVISNIPGAKEYAKNNENCLVCNVDDPVDFAEKIENLLDAPDLRENLSEKAMKTSMNYDWKFVLQRFFSFIDKIEL